MIFVNKGNTNLIIFIIYTLSDYYIFLIQVYYSNIYLDTTDNFVN